MKTGERLKVLRLLSGFTQAKLADITGVNRVSLVHWERGDYNPSTYSAKSLAAVLSCRPDYILCGSPLIDGAVWGPCLPKNIKYLDAYSEDMKRLLPCFIEENGLENSLEITLSDSGSIFLLGKSDGNAHLLMVPAGLRDIVGLATQHLGVTVSLNMKGSVHTFSPENMAEAASLSPHKFDVGKVTSLLDLWRKNLAGGQSKRRFSDKQIMDWGRRYNLNRSIADLRCIFEDAARSLPDED